MIKTILLTVFALVVGILLGSNITQNRGINQAITVDSKVHPEIERFFSEPILGTLDIKLDSNYESTLIDAKPIFSLPETPEENLPTGHIDGLKPFDLNEGADGLTLLRDWDVVEFDIDGDDIAEEIMTNSIGTSDAPQLVRIVKNNSVIFEFVGPMVGVEEVYSKSGFILTTQDWRSKNGIQVRYVVDDVGTIKPLWQQRHAGVKF